MTSDAVKMMYAKSREIVYMQGMEAMWITGILRARAGVATPHRVGAAGTDYCTWPDGSSASGPQNI